MVKLFIKFVYSILVYIILEDVIMVRIGLCRLILFLFF